MIRARETVADRNSAVKMIVVIICCLTLISCSVRVQGVSLGQIQAGPPIRAATDSDQERIDRVLGPRPKGSGVVILGALGILLLSTAFTAGGIYALSE